MCFETGHVPASFSASIVKPILKKPGLDPDQLDNYRPISLTSVLSKLLELLVLTELESSLIPHKLQFGFVHHRTHEASILIGETVQWHLRRGSPVFAANLNARKLFDRIWHDGLFWHLVDLISPRTWHLSLSWYRDLRGTVAFQGGQSCDSSVSAGEPDRKRFSHQRWPMCSSAPLSHLWMIAAKEHSCTDVMFPQFVMQTMCVFYRATLDTSVLYSLL